ncbi:epoxyqueuosine reductase QueH [Candidatus Woesearchaeota archaeon]|nr:epoxyqueuosine reductase QueH [Candidatus Woesearchaeota archaeon]
MKLLLHVCCAPCTAGCLEQLKEYEITMFFSDSNIYPEEEYERRKYEAKKLAEIYGIEFIEDTYDHDEWREFVKGLEKEPEGGKRCFKCFEFNLRRAAEMAKNYDFFTTTLTLSPHKSNLKIFEVGKNFEKFLEKDFKTGWAKSVELSIEHNLYRQNYCGCEFSLRN